MEKFAQTLQPYSSELDNMNISNTLVNIIPSNKLSDVRNRRMSTDSISGLI